MKFDIEKLVDNIKYLEKHRAFSGKLHFIYLGFHSRLTEGAHYENCLHFGDLVIAYKNRHRHSYDISVYGKTSIYDWELPLIYEGRRNMVGSFFDYFPTMTTTKNRWYVNEEASIAVCERLEKINSLAEELVSEKKAKEQAKLCLIAHAEREEVARRQKALEAFEQKILTNNQGEM